jgi:hypothetical protein
MKRASIFPVIVLCTVCLLALSLWPSSRHPRMTGKWTLDARESGVSFDDDVRELPYLVFEDGDAMQLVLSNARMSGRYEVIDDVHVKITPSEYDAPIFLGIHGASGAKKFLTWQLTSINRLEWKRERGQKPLIFTRL